MPKRKDDARRGNIGEPDTSKRKKRTAIERAATRGAVLEEIDTTAGGLITGPEEDWDWLAAASGVAYRTAPAAAKYVAAEFDKLVAHALRSRHIDDEHRDALQIALGRKGMPERMLLANSKLRLQSFFILHRELMKLWRATRHRPDRQWFFISIVGDIGNALELKPEVRIKPFRRIMDKLLRAADLDAIAIIECQHLNNFPRFRLGGTLMFNGHAVGWTDDPNGTAGSIEAQLSGSGRLSSLLQAKTVDVQLIEDRADHVAWRAYYMTKAALVGKFLAPSTETKSGWEMQPTIIRPGQALRIVEGLSQIELTEVVFGVNGGTKISRAWKAELRRWHQEQLERRIPILRADYDMSSLWDAVRPSSRGADRQPFQFFDTAAAGTTSWELAAQHALRELAEKTARFHQSRKQSDN